MTNIGDQHLERYKTKRNLALSLLEIFSTHSIKITTAETVTYLQKENVSSDFEKIDYVIDILPKNNHINLAHLSETNKLNAYCAIKVAELLNIPNEHIQHLVTKLQPPERRQSQKIIHGFSGIDDSYNISYTTSTSGILAAKTRSKIENKKLLVITAGIPELGIENYDANILLGKFLKEHADYVIVLKSIFSQDVETGLKDAKSHIVVDNYSQATQYLQENFNTQEWFLLMQPELTDLYY